MNVLYVIDHPHYGKVVSTDGELGYLPDSLNRFREIEVTNPEDVYGPPLYVGAANQAAKILDPGPYWYEFVDDDVYSD